MRLPPRRSGRAPLAIASFIAIPLFFSSLMASTLAQEKPYVIQWQGVHRAPVLAPALSGATAWTQW